MLKKGGGLGGFSFPNTVVLKTSQLLLGGQVWHKLTLSAEQQHGRVQASAKGDEVDGSLQMVDLGPWRANITYLYYKPQFVNGKSPLAAVDSKAERNSLRNRPALMLRCKSCWLLGQNLVKVEADLTHQGDSLMLEHGLIDPGKGRMTASGQWKQGIQGARSSLKGKLRQQVRRNHRLPWYYHAAERRVI